MEAKNDEARTVFSAEGLAITYMMVALERLLPGASDVVVDVAEHDPLNSEIRRLRSVPPDPVLAELSHRALGLLREARFVAKADVKPKRRAKAGR